METLHTYSGVKRKLLIALDIGTTCSVAHVSCSVLVPGCVPEIKPVTRFSDQEHVGGDTKVPSVLLYNREDGSFVAAGAKAVKIEESFEGDSPPWYKIEWFKLHLRPNPRFTPDITENIPELPPKITILKVFADFLNYLQKSVLDYICETHYNGSNLISTAGYEREFVLSHPNTWEGAQQSQLRKAAILGGLVHDTEEGRGRIHFLSEGEAGLHFCIRRGLTINNWSNGEGILVIDAGGGTIDMSAYGRRPSPDGIDYVEVHEICVSKCLMKGSVFVTRHAANWLEERLQKSPFSQDIQYIASCFDKTTKLRFSDVNEPQYIRFGRPRDNYEKLGIMAGRIKLSGDTVASFFQPSIEEIIQEALAMTRSTPNKNHTVFLIGGFSASDWLYRSLKESLEEEGLSVRRPDSHLYATI
ncbi:hypothetical protein H0H93_007607 [Arthromyces matolae]|nr:hypothetical protein H0H93_007607 [Arthromyces matolae]